MLKIVHLLTGAVALLLSFIPSLRSEALPYLQQPDALYLAFFGLLNLILAPVIPYWNKGPRHQLQNLVSALLILAVALQILVLLAPLSMIAGQPAVLLSLAAAVIAVLVHLAVSFYKSSPSSAAHNYDMSNRDTGTVKWFNTSKGFGFISRDSGDDIFVHFRAIRGEGHRVLVEGQRVEFSVMNRDKGLQAEDVVAASPRPRCRHTARGFFMPAQQQSAASVVRRRRFILRDAELPHHFLMTFEQDGHLQLQTLHHPLLPDQHVVQRLDSVILKRQAGFQLGHTIFKIHDWACT